MGYQPLDASRSRQEKIKHRASETAAVGMHTAASAIRSQTQGRSGRVSQAGDVIAGGIDRTAELVENGRQPSEALQTARRAPNRFPFRMLWLTATVGFVTGRAIVSQLQRPPRRKTLRDRGIVAWHETQELAQEAFEVSRERFEDGRALLRERWEERMRRRAPLWKRVLHIA